MAQHSKKDQIAEAALVLFLEHGIKGTSIDMVVKSSGVSKPTVYNHFPDKSRLFYHTLSLWLIQQPEPGFKARSEKGLLSELERQWLSSDAVRLYGLLIGEGFRVPDAKEKFSQSYDLLWREKLKHWAEQFGINSDNLNDQVNSALLNALL